MRLTYKDIYKLRPAERNPKLHALEDIVESIRTYGFKEIILCDKTTGRIVAGHGRREALIMMHKAGDDIPDGIREDSREGTWLAPIIESEFDSEEAAESYALTANRLIEKGGWHTKLLDKMVAELQPIGFKALKELDADVQKVVDHIPNVDEIMQSSRKSGLIPTYEAGKMGVGAARVDATGLSINNDAPEYRCDIEDIPGNLQGVFQLEEGQIFSSSNKLGIPDLLPDRILPEFPKSLKTWGGIQQTPDDGESFYFYNFGSTPAKGVPYERAIAAYFSTDDHVNTFLDTPAYWVGKYIQAKIHAVVVPDISLWEGNPVAVHIYSMYQAHWLGRFMQEAGLMVVPRFEYFLPDVQEFSLYGIPKGTPTLAAQMHTGFKDEHVPWLQKCLITGLKELEPKQLLVYVSERGAQLVQDVEKELAVEELILLPTAKKVRRPESRAETDPYLKELRKKGRK